MPAAAYANACQRSLRSAKAVPCCTPGITKVDQLVNPYCTVHRREARIGIETTCQDAAICLTDPERSDHHRRQDHADITEWNGGSCKRRFAKGSKSAVLLVVFFGKATNIDQLLRCANKPPQNTRWISFGGSVGMQSILYSVVHPMIFRIVLHLAGGKDPHSTGFVKFLDSIVEFAKPRARNLYYRVDMHARASLLCFLAAYQIAYLMEIVDLQMNFCIFVQLASSCHVHRVGLEHVRGF